MTKWRGATARERSHSQTQRGNRNLIPCRRLSLARAHTYSRSLHLTILGIVARPCGACGRAARLPTSTTLLSCWCIKLPKIFGSGDLSTGMLAKSSCICRRVRSTTVAHPDPAPVQPCHCQQPVPTYCLGFHLQLDSFWGGASVRQSGQGEKIGQAC